VNYVRGPIEQLRTTGLVIPQLSMTIASSIPMGGGLSSSAALEVAILLGVRDLLEQPAEPLAIALEAQEAEHAYAGTPCGIMDMYVSAAARAGNACLIDCATNALTLVPMPSEEQAIVLITDTATRHELSTGAYAERRRDCEEAARILGVSLLGQASIDDVRNAALPDAIAPRARHVVEEIQRVLDFAEVIRNGDLAAAGTLMFESHESLRTLFEVSCPELDLLVDIAKSLSGKGVFGCRMTGGGFGGCTVTLCTREAVPALMDAFEKGFSDRFGRDAPSFATRAADGARVIDQTAT
jgi:galactokinase